MRCTQIFGLNSDASVYLEAHCARTPEKVCPTCGNKTGGDLACHVYASASSSGMFDDGPELFEYDLKSGGKVREIVQDVRWSSGPCIFLCLQDEQSNLICPWSREEIDSA